MAMIITTLTATTTTMITTTIMIMGMITSTAVRNDNHGLNGRRFAPILQC
jgi:hypothetical protein